MSLKQTKNVVIDGRSSLKKLTDLRIREEKKKKNLKAKAVDRRIVSLFLKQSVCSRMLRSLLNGKLAVCLFPDTSDDQQVELAENVAEFFFKSRSNLTRFGL